MIDSRERRRAGPHGGSCCHDIVEENHPRPLRREPIVPDPDASAKVHGTRGGIEPDRVTHPPPDREHSADADRSASHPGRARQRLRQPNGQLVHVVMPSGPDRSRRRRRRHDPPVPIETQEARPTRGDDARGQHGGRQHQRERIGQLPAATLLVPEQSGPQRTRVVAGGNRGRRSAAGTQQPGAPDGLPAALTPDTAPGRAAAGAVHRQQQIQQVGDQRRHATEDAPPAAPGSCSSGATVVGIHTARRGAQPSGCGVDRPELVSPDNRRPWPSRC